MPEDSKYKKIRGEEKKDLKKKIKVESGGYSKNPNKSSFKNKEGVVSKDFSESTTSAKIKDVAHSLLYKAGLKKNRYRTIKVGKGNLAPSTPPKKYPPIDKMEVKKLDEAGNISRRFSVQADKNKPNSQELSKTIESKGYDVSSTESSDLAKKVDEALTKTSIGKDITQKDKEFVEAPEWDRNKRIAANNAKRHAEYLAKKKKAKELKEQNARKPGDRTREVEEYRAGISKDDSLKYGSKYKKIRKKQLLQNKK